MAKVTPAWTQKDIFPSLREAIEQICKRKGEARHNEIVTELLKEPAARAVIDRAIQRRPTYNRRAMAGNMIAWFSQKHTIAGLGELAVGFDKRRDQNGIYTYRPTK